MNPAVHNLFGQVIRPSSVQYFQNRCCVGWSGSIELVCVLRYALKVSRVALCQTDRVPKLANALEPFCRPKNCSRGITVSTLEAVSSELLYAIPRAIGDYREPYE